MPHEGDAMGIDLGMATQEFHRRQDILGEIAIENPSALTMPAKIEGEGSDTPAHQPLGAGTHGAVS